jgi:hypothetical protein
MRMSTARLWRALHGIGGTDWDDMFIHMVLVHVVQMAIMEIVDMAVMEDRCMPTVGAMLVIMVGMMFLVAGGHSVLLSWVRSEDMGRLLSFGGMLHGVFDQPQNVSVRK